MAIFKRLDSLELHRLILIDGQVQKLNLVENKLTLEFKDFSDNQFEFHFKGVCDFIDYNCIGVDISDVKFQPRESLQQIEFITDEKAILSFSYKKYHIFEM
jgi:hypothetical protein